MSAKPKLDAPVTPEPQPAERRQYVYYHPCFRPPPPKRRRRRGRRRLMSRVPVTPGITSTGVRITIRLGLSEAKALGRVAIDNGMTLSEVLRDALYEAYEIGDLQSGSR